MIFKWNAQNTSRLFVRVTPSRRQCSNGTKISTDLAMMNWRSGTNHAQMLQNGKLSPRPQRTSVTWLNWREGGKNSKDGKQGKMRDEHWVPDPVAKWERKCSNALQIVVHTNKLWWRQNCQVNQNQLHKAKNKCLDWSNNSIGPIHTGRMRCMEWVTFVDTEVSTLHASSNMLSNDIVSNGVGLGPIFACCFWMLCCVFAFKVRKMYLVHVTKKCAETK